QRKEARQECGSLIDIKHRLGLNRMHQENRSSADSRPSFEKFGKQKEQQSRIRDVQQHIHHVIRRRTIPGNQMVQIETEKCQFPQVKRIQEMIPVCRVRYVCIIRDQHIVKMKRIIE